MDNIKTQNFVRFFLEDDFSDNELKREVERISRDHQMPGDIYIMQKDNEKEGMIKVVVSDMWPISILVNAPDTEIEAEVKDNILLNSHAVCAESFLSYTNEDFMNERSTAKLTYSKK